MPKHVMKGTPVAERLSELKRKTYQVQSVRCIAILVFIKANHPCRTTTTQVCQWLESNSDEISLRSVQRNLHAIRKTGLINVDGACSPNGWFLTEQGKEFLGVQS